MHDVLLIVVDQWRADMLPGSAALPIDLPNIRRLMREGAIFRNHFTTAVPCGPARASLLTGLYLMNHRAVHNTVPLDRRHVTLAQTLRAIGYDPALIGYTTTTPDPRHHLAARSALSGARRPDGRVPQRRRVRAGYGRIFRLGCAGGLPAAGESDRHLASGGRGRGACATDRPARIPRELSDSAFFTERALTYLKGRNGKPWFLHLGYYRPHPPFVVSAPYHALVRPDQVAAPVRAASPAEEAKQHPLLAYYLGAISQGSFFQRGSGLGAEMDEVAVRQMRATYCGMLAEIDDCLGEVFAYLDATRQWRDTLVIFTSDHGEQLGDHWLLGKLGNFDESFRIPLTVRDPRAEAEPTRGRMLDVFTESVDMMPTILDWLGGDVPRAVDGRSLLPLLEGETPRDWRDAVTYEFDFRDVFYSHPETALGLAMDHCSLAVIQDSEAKYVHFAGLPPLFFDLHQDPHQFHDRAADPGLAPRIKDYAQRLLTHRLRHADRTLTHFRATPHGLEERRPAR
jgi:arylsulfatase A-like enzyme